MSYKADKWAWKQDLPPAPKLVLMFLASSHNEKLGRCFPSVKTIAERCRISEPTVFKYLKYLQSEECDCIISVQNKRRNGRQTSNEYILHFDREHHHNQDPDLKSLIQPDLKFFTPSNKGSKLYSKNIISDSGESPKPPSVKSFKLQPVPIEPDLKSEPEKEPDYSSLDPGLRRPPPKPIVVNIPNNLLPLVEQWREVGIAHKQGTKSLRDGVSALREVINGKFYLDRSRHECQDYAAPYRLKDIEHALEAFDLKRNDANYLPTNKHSLKSLSLALFFHNPNWTNGNGNGNGRSRSMFLQCLHQKPQLAADRNPELTEFVCDKHREFTGKQLQYSGATSASSKFARYWKEKEDWLKNHGVATPKRLVVQWMQMLGDRHGVNWDVGMILSRNMNEAFEKYVYARNG